VEVAPVARGDVRRRERGRIHQAVSDAREATGLDIVVYFARPRRWSLRDQALQTMAASRLAEGPGVLVMVVPRERRVELVTAPAARDRLSDEACGRVVQAMTSEFRSGRRLGAGIEAGMAAIAAEVT
jgi:uncharacterized membrane protein YgcG